MAPRSRGIADHVFTEPPTPPADQPCLIDGEAVCCDENGLAVFARLRHRERPAEIFLYAFDFLELDGQDLRRERLETRKATLASLLHSCGPGLRLVEHLDHGGDVVYRHARRSGWWYK